MNEQNQAENIEETVKIGTENPKEEEEDTIEQVNKQVIEDKDKNDDEEQEENINIVKDEININNESSHNNNIDKDNNKDIIGIEIKDDNSQKHLNNMPNNNYKNLTIQNNNFNISTHTNSNQNTKYNNNINNYISKTNYNQNYNNKMNNNYLNKFENYNDELKRYYFNKEYSNFHINMEENFLERMQFDIYKRQIKEERLNDLVEQNKVKIDEEQKIKTFNRLIEDANRRLKAQINMSDLENQLNDDFISSTNFYKKYNDEQWNEIYNKRFKAYQENKNKRREQNQKLYEEEKKKKEEEIINLCQTKKAPIKHILEASQKLYDEAKKRKIKIKEKKENANNRSNISNNQNNKNIKKIKVENEDKTIEISENDILNQFLMNNINNCANNNQKKIRKNKSTTNNKIILKKNKNQVIPVKGKYKNINYGYTPNKNINSYNTKNLNNKKNNSNLFINNNFDLEEERKILIQMAKEKVLPHFQNINKVQLTDNPNINNVNNINQKLEKKNNNKNYLKTESDMMIEEFFMRNIK